MGPQLRVSFTSDARRLRNSDLANRASLKSYMARRRHTNGFHPQGNLDRGSPEDVWAAVRDVGAVHQRLAPGFAVDTRLDGDARVVTFANGRVVRELLVDIDDNSRRVAYAVEQRRPTHHNSSMQVFAEADGRSRLVWITDILPNDVAGVFASVIEQGAAVMKQTLEGRTALGSAGWAQRRQRPHPRKPC
jgi:hypothetical protein